MTGLSGLFGGTFDPIHFGHLRTALELLDHLQLAEVRFTPCGEPPHGKTPTASASIRLAMVQAAIAGQPGFVVDERELNRPGPSYTVETLEALRGELSSQPIGLIVGMDAFIGMDSWHRSEEILQLAHIIVARRPGVQRPASGPVSALLAAHEVADCAALAAAPAGKILVHTVTQLEISSSAIRSAARDGQSQRYLVPDSVATLIETSNCYTS